MSTTQEIYNKKRRTRNAPCVNSVGIQREYGVEGVAAVLADAPQLAVMLLGDLQRNGQTQTVAAGAAGTGAGSIHPVEPLKDIPGLLIAQ